MALNEVKLKKKFLEALAKYPSATLACKQANIAHSTIYRWRDDDPLFANEWEQTLERESYPFLADMAIQKLGKGVQEEHWPSIKFTLQHLHPQFKPQLPTNPSIPRRSFKPIYMPVLNEDAFSPTDIAELKRKERIQKRKKLKKSKGKSD